MTSEMELVVDAGGSVRCIYDEGIDLREIGTLRITRASARRARRRGLMVGRHGAIRWAGAGALWKPVGGVGGGEGVAQVVAWLA
jgi:hypothetical protein